LTSQDKPQGLPPGPNPRRWRILAVVLLGGMMGPIDSSIVNANLPSIAGYFGAPMSLAGWIQVSYLLTIGSLLLTVGRLGELHGFRRLYIRGLVAFAVFSAACGLSPTVHFLIAARALQGAGASMFMAVSPAIITATFPPYERGRALGLNGMAVAVGLAVGPVLGGLITQHLGWRWLFYINLPVAAAAIYASLRTLPEDRPLTEGHLDTGGALLGFLGLFLVLLLANQAETVGFSSPFWLAGALLTVGVVWAFIRLERRHPEPTLDLTLFGSRPFTLAVLAALFNFMVQFTVVFVVPFVLQQAVGLTPEGTGLVLSVSPVVTLLVAPFSGALSDVIGTRGLAAAGTGLVLAAMVLLSVLPFHPHPLDVAWRLGLMGLGTSVFQSPNSSAAMGSAPRTRLGQASAVLATVRNVGMSLGVAIASGAFAARYAAARAAGLADELALVTSARQTLTIGAVFAVGSLLAAALSPGVRAAERPGASGPGGRGPEAGAGEVKEAGESKVKKG